MPTHKLICPNCGMLANAVDFSGFETPQLYCARCGGAECHWEEVEVR